MKNYLLILFVLFIPKLAIAQQIESASRLALWVSGAVNSLTNDNKSQLSTPAGAFEFGIGYEYHWESLFMQLGADVSSFNSTMHAPDKSFSKAMIDSEGDAYTGLYQIYDIKSKQQLLNSGLSLHIGYQFAKGWYFLLGPKYQINWSFDSKSSAIISTQAQYANIIGNDNGIIGDMPNHGLNTLLRTNKRTFTLGPTLIGHVEMGFVFNKKLKNFSMVAYPDIRLALFADYGAGTFDNKYSSNDVISQITNSIAYQPMINELLFCNTTSNKYHSFVVGLKASWILGFKTRVCRCER